jgi:DNA polymerase III subunit beta
MKTIDLKRIFEAFDKVVSSNPVVPILEYIRVSNGEMCASDLHNTIIFKTGLTGEFLIPFREMKKMLALLSDGSDVTFDPGELKIKVTTEAGVFTFDSEDPKDFIKTPEVSKEKFETLSASDLQRIGAARRFTSRDELRPAMCGVLIGDGFITSTDGHRMHYRPMTSLGVGIIISRKCASIVADLPGTEISYTSNLVRFESGDMVVVSRLIEERYPERENVIPLKSKSIVTIDRLSFIKAVALSAIAANKVTHQTRFSFSATEVTVFSEDLDFATAFTAKLPCELTGPEVTIGFNAKFLLEALEEIDTPVVTLKMNEPNKSIIINDCHLLMPVMLNQYV